MAKKAVKKKRKAFKKKQVTLFARAGNTYVQIFSDLKERKEITTITDQDGKILDRHEEVIEEEVLLTLCEDGKKLLGLTNGDFQLNITVTKVK
jgi:hypothetical protein